MGGPGLGHFPGCPPPAPAGPGPGDTPRLPCSSHRGDSHATPPLFLPSFTPPIPPSPPAAEQVVWQRERFPSRGRAGQGRAGGSGRPAPLPGPGGASRSRGSRQGQGLLSAPGAGGGSGDAGARRCPHSAPPRSASSRAIPGTAALAPGGRIPGMHRCVPAAGESGRPPCAGRGCAGRAREERRWGEEERRGEEGASPAAARPSAGTARPSAGAARRRSGGGRPALPRGRAISGQGPAGDLGRFLGRCRPRLRGSSRSPRIGFINMSAGACRGDP